MKPNSLGWTVLALGVVVAASAAADSFIGDEPAGPTHNGLSGESFRRNALTTNEQALKILLRDSLNDALETPYIRRQLRDPHARAMLKELVKCALDSKTRVTAKDDADNAIGPLRGEVNLCPEWRTSKLDGNDRCQQLLTACVMARVNGLGKSIPLSLRGELPKLSPADRAPIDTNFRESRKGQDPAEGRLIGSFSTDCVGPDCNWSPAYVGTCVGTEAIKLAIDDPSACAATTLRVCTGIQGCLSPAVHALPDGSPVPSYSKRLEEQKGACKDSPLRFNCPSTDATVGFYSVMVQPAHPQPSKLLEVSEIPIKQIKGSGSYPASPTEVFAFAEGAFFGNLFRPHKLVSSCEVKADDDAIHCTDRRNKTCKIPLRQNRASSPAAPPVAAVGTVESTLFRQPMPRSAVVVEDCPQENRSLPYEGVYACFTYANQVDSSVADEYSVAALNDRLCDSPGAECFPVRPRRCHFRDREINQSKGSHCEAMGKDGAYGSCADPRHDDEKFEWIVTTYLNDPCDLVGDGRLCEAMRSSLAASSRLVHPVGPRVHTCGGCALDGTGGALQPASIAATVALLLGRRRRRRSRSDAPASSARSG